MCVCHSFQRLFCLTSWFELFCVPLPLILDSALCSIVTCRFWTLLCFFYFVLSIGLHSGFDPLHVTLFMVWISFVDSVHWQPDPVSGLSFCLWTLTPGSVPISVCLTLIKFNKHSLHLTFVFVLSSWPQISEIHDYSIKFGGTHYFRNLNG